MDNVLFPSSGDPEKDAKTAASIRRSMGLQSEGLCPNACGPLSEPDDDHIRTCAICGFVKQTIFIGSGDVSAEL